MYRRGATSRSTPALCLRGRVNDSSGAVKVIRRMAGAPLSRTAWSSPHRCSCTMPGRAIWCVDIVSVERAFRSRRATSCPCLASRSAVAAPAARAPTTITSWRWGSDCMGRLYGGPAPAGSVVITEIGRRRYRHRRLRRRHYRGVGCDNPGVAGRILERDRELGALAAAAGEARAGDGSVVIIAGEAGIGKSSLVDALGSVLPPGTRLLVGYCDDLATPRVLGPLRDLIGSVGGALTHALESGDRSRVSDALRARLAELDAPTRDAVEQLAVVPSAAERWLVEAVVPGGLASLAAAERRGVLTVSATRVAFPHELARRAVVDRMPTARRVACNQAVLAALLDRHDGVDVSRILHHAAQAGAGDVIVRHGPAAAREAAAAGAHREAVAHYRLVLDHRQVFPPGERADLLDEHAVECYTVGLAALAVRAQEEAVGLRRTLGDPRALGLSLRWLSRMHWWAGARAKAEASAAEAIEVLEAGGDERALALALSNQSQLHMLAGRRSESVAAGQRAVAMARDLGDAALLSHALNNVGTALWDDGKPESQALLDESLTVALDAGEVEHACRAYINIAWHFIDVLRFAEAERIVEDAIELADEAEFDGFLRYLQVTRSMVYLALGRWREVEREVPWADDAEPIVRCPALIVLGTVRVRRGQEDGEQLLEQAWQIAQRLGEAQRLGPAAAALLEAAWLRGDVSRVAVVAPAYEEVRRYGRLSAAAEFGYWMRAAGEAVPINESDHPYILLAKGQWRQAAEAWQRAGCPYEHAVALAQSPDPADLLHALTTLDALGAEPLARRVRLRLRELGVTRIPRGRVQSTRDNLAGLTERQADVVRLLAEGLTNAEIAARLVLSVRTVDTHVAAILNKLDAKTRRDAVARAKALGLLDNQAGPNRTG